MSWLVLLWQIFEPGRIFEIPVARFTWIHGWSANRGPTMDERRKSDLKRWLARLLAALGHKVRAWTCPAYVAGLIGAGDRKSIQPMAARDGDFGYDQLHHVIANRTWDAALFGPGGS